MKTPKNNDLNEEEISISFIFKPRGSWYNADRETSLPTNQGDLVLMVQDACWSSSHHV